MPQQQPQMGQGFLQKPEQVFNAAYYFANAAAASLTPILRSRMGTHAFYHAGIPGLFYIFFFAGLADSMLLVWYIPVWIVLVVYRRFTAARDEHSEWRGYSWMLGFLPDKGAKAVEPWLVFFAAAFLSPYSEALASFLGIGAIALFVVNMMDRIIIDNILRRQRDAEITMQQMMQWRDRS